MNMAPLSEKNTSHDRVFWLGICNLEVMVRQRIKLALI